MYQRIIPTASLVAESYQALAALLMNGETEPKVPSYVTTTFSSILYSRDNDRYLINGNGSNGAWTENTDNCFLKKRKYGNGSTAYTKNGRY